MSGRAGAAADAEVVADGDLHKVRNAAERIDSQRCRVGDAGSDTAVIAPPRDRGVGGIDDRRADGKRVAQRQGLRPLFVTGNGGGQQVFAVVYRRVHITGGEIAAIDGVPRALHVIDATDVLIFVAGRRNAVRQLAAGVGGLRNIFLNEVQSLRIKTRDGDDVAGEDRAGIGRIGQDFGLAAGHARAGIDGAEIALQRCRGGHEADGLRRVAAVARPLVAAEEEELVAFDSAAERAAELIALQRVVRGREVVAGVHVAVAKKLEGVAMPGVGAGFRHGVHHAAGMQTASGGQAAGLDAEFLQGVGELDGQVHV